MEKIVWSIGYLKKNKEISSFSSVSWICSWLDHWGLPDLSYDSSESLRVWQQETGTIFHSQRPRCPKMPRSYFVQHATGVPIKLGCRLYDLWVQVKPGHSKGMSWGYLLTTAGMTAAPRPKPYSQVLPAITQMEPSPHIRTCECNW